jgi:hypothetical protein
MPRAGTSRWQCPKQDQLNISIDCRISGRSDSRGQARADLEAQTRDGLVRPAQSERWYCWQHPCRDPGLSVANLPKEVTLPRPTHREVARILVERREYPVVDVVEAIGAFSQPGLLVTDAKQVDTKTLAGHANTNLVVAPLSREPGLIES